MMNKQQKNDFDKYLKEELIKAKLNNLEMMQEVKASLLQLARYAKHLNLSFHDCITASIADVKSRYDINK